MATIVNGETGFTKLGDACSESDRENKGVNHQTLLSRKRKKSRRTRRRIGKRSLSEEVEEAQQ